MPSELDKLEMYLITKGIRYERIDEPEVIDQRTGMIISLGRHQIVVPDRVNRMWDAICHRGSYGYEEGLLEVMGTIVDPNCGDTVEGFLMASEVIERLEKADEQANEPV